jgi:isoquinoline 1-oxidoreductase
VVAPDPATAQRALGAIRAKWDVPSQPSNRELVDVLKNGSGSGSAERPQYVAGSVAQALDGAEIKVEEQYTIQYIAHAPLEPRAAVAEWNGDRLTVWTGTQRPFGVRDELAAALKIPAENVRVIQPDMGAGYGGKHTGEAAVEAARLARVAGKPVKLEWTRQEEFTWAYFRPAGVIEIRAGARRDGTLLAWEFHNYNSGNAGIGTPYAVSNQIIQYHAADSPLRQGSYRSLAAAANHFARESAMDSVAAAAGIDSLAFRMKNLTDTRLQAVFQAAAGKFGWDKAKSTPQRGFGIAGGTEKGGYVATCAEVEIDPASKKVRVRRVVQAWESGAIVNPDGLRNQLSGAIVQGLGGALFEQVLFAGGRIQNASFAQYRLPRFSDTPEIEIVLLDRKDLPSAGAGETGIVGIAPAVGNAIFAATGIRLRSMPMAPRAAAPGQPDSGVRS